MAPWIVHLESAARFVVAVMFNSIWEDAILVFAVWLLLRAIREVNASTRYFSWLVTMIAAVVLPVITTIPQTTFQPAASAQAAAHATVAARHDAVPQAGHRSNAHATGSAPRLVGPATGTPAAVSRFRTPERLQLHVPSWLATLLFCAWILIAVFIAGRLAFDLYLLERLKRDSLPLPVAFRDTMEQWVEAAYGNARDVRICVSDRIEVPVAVGLFDSMILLPQHLLDELSAGELDRISLHELAHLHRRDDWTNSVQRFAQTVLFFNPAVRFIGSNLDLEREVACDDWVLSRTGDVRPYATCLTRLAELTAWPHRPLAAPGVFVTRKGISVRIERLLNKRRNSRVQVAYGVPAAVTGALVAFFILANGIT
ncbi:MAG: M56 family metallopeptidase, partial [Candidatus Eremiobacteraeota bacterium]|nr:M56 family metallopeptidase [Candidatus Eremiobacteraeota bacterium]